MVGASRSSFDARVAVNRYWQLFWKGLVKTSGRFRQPRLHAVLIQLLDGSL
jgi:hypothetical protein